VAVPIIPGRGASRDLTLNLHEKRTGNALAQTARDLDKLAKGVDATGDSMAGMSRDADRLNVEMAETQTRIRQLSQDFARTGDRPIFGDLKKEEANLRNLRKVLSGLGEMGDAGQKAGKSFVRSFGGTLGSIPGTLRGGLIASLVALAGFAAPAIGAAVAGAVTGAVGVGGIAGGIFAASRDPQVRGAAKSFGEVISEEFFRSGRSFVEPIKRALRSLEGDFEKLDLAKTFKLAAPLVNALADGIGQMVRNIMPGFNKALERSGPFMAVLSEGLMKTGSALGMFFDSVSKSEGSVQGLEFLFRLLNNTLYLTGRGIEFLSDTYAKWLDIQAKTTGVLEDIGGPLQSLFRRMNDGFEDMQNNFPLTGQKIGEYVSTVYDGARSADEYTRSIEAQAQALDTLRGVVEAALTSEMSLDQANLGVARATQDLTQSLKDNGKAWDVNTQKGLDNSSMLLAKVEALGRQRQARINQGVDAEKANAMYDKEIAKLVAFGKRMGMTKKQIADLIGDHYVRIHFKVDPLPRYTIHPTAVLEAKGRAAGGPVEAGVPYQINERGRETVTFPAGGQVHPANLTPMSTGGSQRLEARLHMPPGLERGLVRMLMEALRLEIKAVAGSGPNSVQRALT
jgi:hypothetical protein